MILTLFSQDKNFSKQNGSHISHVDISQILPYQSFLVPYLSSNNVQPISITNQIVRSQKGVLIGKLFLEVLFGFSIVLALNTCFKELSIYCDEVKAI